MNALCTKNLNFQYGINGFSIKNINLEVLKGSIYGLIGPNGNGKSTTIKTCLDLLEKDSGEVTFFDKTIEERREQVLQNIGCLLDSEGYYPDLNVRDNLEIVRLLKKLPKSAIDEVYEKLNLNDLGNKPVKSFSTGMKQRLSIAMAIIGSPKLIIVDEPLNGLDPEVVTHVRNLFIELHKNGSTLIISSHILSELEKIVTHIGIIKHGKLLLQGSIDTLVKDTKISLEELYLKTINKTEH